MNLEAILEGLLFVVGDEGLTIDKIATILEISMEEAVELLNKLIYRYEQEDRGIHISFLGNHYKLTTKLEHKEYYKKLIESPLDNGLSNAALEVLAITVYNEPITRVDIDKIRGIYSGQMIRKLVAKGMLKEAGRSETPGRPILYKTTDEFLDYFGLSSKEQLPIPNIRVAVEDEDAYLFNIEKEE